MAYAAIAGTLPQYSKDGDEMADGYYLKAYEAGTTTPLSMATDSTGATTLAKCKLNANGFPISNESDETSEFIPHMNATYKLVLYKNSTDADNNTTGSAEWVIDNFPDPNVQKAWVFETVTANRTVVQADAYTIFFVTTSGIDIDLPDAIVNGGPWRVLNKSGGSINIDPALTDDIDYFESGGGGTKSTGTALAVADGGWAYINARTTGENTVIGAGLS